ncbi:LacI family DNA-binding transcriptional regulator [Treponema sp. Marseille-Q4523]|uniref:LacI family DNA-binding transcriptional regulator n=1 Tax=Treponema sp. Marseille-Q4523 TaxID=2810610 RepID=UPI001961324E|nr:LacI family DNA-binding transcriptional regulator [Treponema sp. Marseille-Q4523]MBM7022999.1 LacI family DNA-binding transcriptional regulator [Treponema sp. Marseille-Q4523]
MVSIRDVAKHAGVSVSTVSRCLHNYYDVKKQTKEKVMQVIDELRYVPNFAAQSMTQERTYMVGLTIPDIMDSYFAENAAGAEDTLLSYGYHVMYGSLARSKRRLLDFLRQAKQFRLDGLIITPDSWDEETVAALKDIDIPIVALRRRPPKTLSIPYVDTDHYSGARKMVSYLIKHGHRNISHIAFPTVIGEERLKGYCDEMRIHGLKAQWIMSNALGRMKQSIESGVVAMQELLRKNTETTAVFASNDLLAVGAVEYVKSIGKSIPHDISICGIDNLELTSLPSYNLTTMALQRKSMGEAIAKMLFSMMDKDSQEKPESLLFDSEIIERSSVKFLG